MSVQAVRIVFARARLALALVLFGAVLSARAADGDIDTSFGTSPQSGTTVLDRLTSNTFANAVEVTGSGQVWLVSTKTLVGTPVELTSFWVTRLLASGIPDKSFNSGGPEPSLIDLFTSGPFATGLVAAAVDIALSGPASSNIAYVLFQGSSVVEAVDRQPDGLVQFGDLIGRLPIDTGGSSYVGIAKIAADGTLDTSFGSGGYVWVMSGAVTARALDIDRAGNILVLSNAKDLNSFHITRISPSGFIDTTWAGAGTQSVTLPGVFMHAMKLDSQDRIVLSGMRANPSTAGNWDGLIYRALPNGTSDSAFGTAGMVTVVPDLGGDNVDSLNDLVIDMPGAIFAVGASRTGLATQSMACTVARVDPNGTNPTFELINAGTQRECAAVAIASSNGDRVYAAGRTRVGAQVPQRGRLFAVRASNLQADTSFGAEGIANTLAFNDNFDVTDVTVDASQRPVIVGGVAVQGESSYAARYVKSNLLFSDSFE
jgi:uncharacterized delta-60 repeat protein